MPVCSSTSGFVVFLGLDGDAVNVDCDSGGAVVRAVGAVWDGLAVKHVFEECVGRAEDIEHVVRWVGGLEVFPGRVVGFHEE